MPRTRRWILRMRYRMRCANGHESTTHVGAGFEAGVEWTETSEPHHGSTPWHEMAELNAYQNPVYAEVQHLVQELRGQAPDRRNCFHRVLGAACDPAPSRHRYRFAGRAQRQCLVCGQEAEEFAPVFSGDGKLCEGRVEIPLVTHREWEGLRSASACRRPSSPSTASRPTTWWKPLAIGCAVPPAMKASPMSLGSMTMAGGTDGPRRTSWLSSTLTATRSLMKWYSYSRSYGTTIVILITVSIKCWGRPATQHRPDTGIPS